MKKHFLILSILLFSINAFSQAITQKSIVGKWKVVAVLSKIDNPNLKDIVRGFKNSTFDFKESSAVNLTTTDNSKLFSMITAMINKSKWRLKENNFVVEVGSESDNYNIMKIIITEVNDKIIFHLHETELDLQVVKQ